MCLLELDAEVGVWAGAETIGVLATAAQSRVCPAALVLPDGSTQVRHQLRVSVSGLLLLGRFARFPIDLH